MQPKSSSNPFAAFNRGLTGKTGPAENPAVKNAPPAEEDTLVPSRALLMLADSPQGVAPFGLFSQFLPGDNLSAMTSALQLMKRGWVEFVGGISDSSDIRLTDSGRELAETLRKSFG